HAELACGRDERDLRSPAGTHALIEGAQRPWGSDEHPAAARTARRAEGGGIGSLLRKLQASSQKARTRARNAAQDPCLPGRESGVRAQIRASFPLDGRSRSIARAEAAKRSGAVAGGRRRGVRGDERMVEDATSHRVLVVDDEASLVEVVTMALRFQGFTVESVGTGRDALAAVTRFKPHLMVLDV